MGGANISEVAQVIDLVHEVQNDRDRRLNTFVIGVWFGMFVDSDIKYTDPDRNRGETDLDIETIPLRLLSSHPTGPVAVLPPNWLDAGVMAIRPILLVEKIAREARAGDQSNPVTGRTSAQRTDAEREVAVMSEEDKKKALEYWNETMGRKSEISRSQVALLRDTIELLAALGGEGCPRRSADSGLASGRKSVPTRL